MDLDSEKEADVSSLTETLRSANIRSTSEFRRAIIDESFRQAFFSALKETARRNGSTITLSGVATWISIAVGSIGIAGMGTAIGVPLGAILIPLALLGGGFLDEDGALIRGKRKLIGLFSKSVRGKENVQDAGFAAVTEALTLISARVDLLSEEMESVRTASAEVQSLLIKSSRYAKRQNGLIVALAVLVGFLSLALFYATSWLKR